MKVELSKDEIEGILYAIEQSEAKEIIRKLNLDSHDVSKGLHSAEYKLTQLRKNFYKGA
jgi:DNA-binding MarR family transcriptional regulator